ncbi:MAG: GNAT family N-acetyltransferase, partial [Oscillospiraceae bacterium]|nr:GNAT family N-acetyltransferase [Oscillospiraceae bacterium]
LVYDAYRRRGYGSAILAELDRALRLAKTPSILLHAFAHNVPAIKLYEKCGFAVVKSDGRNTYMKKELA